MGARPALELGAWRRLDGGAGGNVLKLPAHHLVTHGVVVGMTGSGKTGLVTVLLEEALRAGVPSATVESLGYGSGVGARGAERGGVARVAAARAGSGSGEE